MTLRIRQAARAVVLSADRHVLLVRFEFRGPITRWALPGGGREAGESAIDALRRELAEEVGLTSAPIGAHIWSRRHIVPFDNGEWDGQEEQIHLVQVEERFTPTPALSWAQLNAENVVDMRWWAISELHDAPETFVPGDLAELLEALVSGGPPAAPIVVGV